MNIVTTQASRVLYRLSLGILWGIFSFYCTTYTHACGGYEDIYHHGSEVVCLRKNTDLCYPCFKDIVRNELKSSIKKIDLSEQTQLSDQWIKFLVKHSQASGIIMFDLSHTKITGKSMKYLWESKFIGSYRTDELEFHRQTLRPMSDVIVEVAHTPLSENYKDLIRDDNSIFPLPIRGKFELIHQDYCGRKSYDNALKRVLLYDHGKRLGNQ